MIIWGWRGRKIVKKKGEFHCPECDELQDYKKVRVATYFTLYFIPLFETRHHGDYVECLNCGGQFKPAVIDYRPASKRERAVASIRQDLESGTPVQMARTKLTNAGMAAELAEQLVAEAAGNDARTCQACDLDFVATIRRCSVCGSDLNSNVRREV